VFGRTRTRAFGAATALIAVGVLSVPVIAGPVGAQTATPGVSVVNCNVTTYRFLFWPKGHGKVKSQNFPEYTVPHVELYTGTGKKFTDDQSLAYVDSAGQNSHAPTCTTASLTGAAGGAIPADKLAKTTKTTVLACTAPSASVLTVPTAAKAVLSLVLPGASVASATMSGLSSELQYDTSMCKLQKAPK
jgi:hypothetical protein